jgi:hypothetical protein
MSEPGTEHPSTVGDDATRDTKSEAWRVPPAEYRFKKVSQAIRAARRSADRGESRGGRLAATSRPAG